MKVSDAVSELQVKMEEPQNKRDERVEALWKKLNPAGHGELDFKGLQKGLRRIDHRKTSRFRALATLCSCARRQL